MVIGLVVSARVFRFVRWKFIPLDNVIQHRMPFRGVRTRFEQLSMSFDPALNSWYLFSLQRDFSILHQRGSILDLKKSLLWLDWPLLQIGIYKHNNMALLWWNKNRKITGFILCYFSISDGATDLSWALCCWQNMISSLWWYWARVGRLVGSVRFSLWQGTQREEK